MEVGSSDGHGENTVMDCRPTFSIALPSELRMLSVARTFVEAVCQACHLDRSTLHALVLVTGEAITNIVRHAHRDRPRAQMEIRLELAMDRAVLTFIDQGEPFDIGAVPHLDPSELRIGGRGVYLMRTLMDEVTCAPRGQGQPGNTLRLVKRLGPVPALRDVG
jgi:serine/threonine-protein kinase RsbW